MATTLLHVGKAITPKGEIADAAILIRDGEIEMVGPRGAMELPAGAEEVRASESTAIRAAGGIWHYFVAGNYCYRQCG